MSIALAHNFTGHVSILNCIKQTAICLVQLPLKHAEQTNLPLIALAAVNFQSSHAQRKLWKDFMNLIVALDQELI